MNLSISGTRANPGKSLHTKGLSLDQDTPECSSVKADSGAESNTADQVFLQSVSDTSQAVTKYQLLGIGATSGVYAGITAAVLLGASSLGVSIAAGAVGAVALGAATWLGAKALSDGAGTLGKALLPRRAILGETLARTGLSTAIAGMIGGPPGALAALTVSTLPAAMNAIRNAPNRWSSSSS